MPITMADLVTLRKRIELDRKKLEAREQAVMVLEAMLQEENGGEQRSLDLVGPDQAPSTLTDKVRKIIRNFGGSEFTVAHVETQLRDAKVPLPEKSRARISMILSSLVSKGNVERTFKGGGNVPHRYKAND